MPLITTSTGTQTYVSDDVARAMAAQLIHRIESATRRSEQAGGPLSASAARQVHADFEQAEDLLRQTGDVKEERYFQRSDLSRFYQPGESERILADRAQLRREAETVVQAGSLLGQKWSEAAIPEESDGPANAATPVEKSPGHWVIQDSRGYRYFTSRAAAEAEARKRRQ